MSTSPTMQDEVALRQLIKDVEYACNRLDGYAFARIFADDGEFRAIGGQKHHGRASIARDYRQLLMNMRHEQHPIELKIARVRFIREDIAYLEAIGGMQYESNRYSKLIGIAIAVKEAGIWRFVTFNKAGLLPASPDHVEEKIDMIAKDTVQTNVRYSNRRYMENTATGEKFDIIKTAADTNGEYAEAILTVPAGFKPLPLHAHPKQSEEFTILSGKMGIKNNGEEYILGPGENIISTAGSAHTWWNAGDEELRFHSKITPCLHIFEIIGSVYDSANARKSTEPSLLDAIYVLVKYRDEYDPLFLPKPVQMIGFPILYAIGKLMGRHRIVDANIASYYE